MLLDPAIQLRSLSIDFEEFPARFGRAERRSDNHAVGWSKALSGQPSGQLTSLPCSWARHGCSLCGLAPASGRRFGVAMWSRLGGVSHMTMSALRLAGGIWAPKSSRALVLVPCVPQSWIETVLPACRNASYSSMQTVLLPTPPFLARCSGSIS
jgi:hypothetical protein